MTPEDLEQIRQIVAEQIAESEARIKALQERAMVAVADEFTELRTELGRRFAEIDRRLDGLDRRVDRINEGLQGVEVRMTSLTQ